MRQQAGREAAAISSFVASGAMTRNVKKASRSAALVRQTQFVFALPACLIVPAMKLLRELKLTNPLVSASRTLNFELGRVLYRSREAEPAHVQG
jgi:hypothetical protein